MIHLEIDIAVDYTAMGCAEPKRSARLTGYILDTDYLNNTCWSVRPAVIVCPGGGYSWLAPREAEPIALSYCAAGFHAFVLSYSVAPTGWPAACCELSKTVAYVHSIASQYGIDKDKIVVCGASAGGHLAASLGVYWNDETIQKYSDVRKEENRPNGLILAYPVITGTETFTHPGSLKSFMSGREDARSFFSLEKHVTEYTPQSFIWHTFSDQSVPAANSIRFAEALMEHGVPCEFHMFPKGVHGLALSSPVTADSKASLVPSVEPWMALSVTWLNNL